MQSTTSHPVFDQIDAWYTQAPSGLTENEVIGWVQQASDIRCPNCGDLLYVLRVRRAQNRGIYHLAMCHAPECEFQIDD